MARNATEQQVAWPDRRLRALPVSARPPGSAGSIGRRWNRPNRWREEEAGAGRTKQRSAAHSTSFDSSKFDSFEPPDRVAIRRSRASCVRPSARPSSSRFGSEIWDLGAGSWELQQLDQQVAVPRRTRPVRAHLRPGQVAQQAHSNPLGRCLRSLAPDRHSRRRPPPPVGRARQVGRISVSLEPSGRPESGQTLTLVMTSHSRELPPGPAGHLLRAAFVCLRHLGQSGSDRSGALRSGSIFGGAAPADLRAARRRQRAPSRAGGPGSARRPPTSGQMGGPH